jgi:hypothetical protein
MAPAALLTSRVTSGARSARAATDAGSVISRGRGVTSGLVIVAARRHKAALTAYFAAQARRGGAADPAALGDQLTVVFDGVAARAVVRGEGAGALGVSTAAVLLDAAGIVAG